MLNLKSLESQMEDIKHRLDHSSYAYGDSGEAEMDAEKLLIIAQSLIAELKKCKRAS